MSTEVSPGSGTLTHAINRPSLPELKHVRPNLSKVRASSRSARGTLGGVTLQSSSRFSVPLHLAPMIAISGKAFSVLMILGKPVVNEGTTVPAPRPSCRHATVASAASKPLEQTWVQEPSKNISRRPVVQLSTSASSTSLRSPSSASPHGAIY